MLLKYTRGHMKKRQEFLREAAMRRVSRGVMSLVLSVQLEAGSSGQTWATVLHRTPAASIPFQMSPEEGCALAVLEVEMLQEKPVASIDICGAAASQL